MHARLCRRKSSSTYLFDVRLHKSRRRRNEVRLAAVSAARLVHVAGLLLAVLRHRLVDLRRRRLLHLSRHLPVGLAGASGRLLLVQRRRVALLLLLLVGSMRRQLVPVRRRLLHRLEAGRLVGRELRRRRLVRRRRGCRRKCLVLLVQVSLRLRHVRNLCVQKVVRRVLVELVALLRGARLLLGRRRVAGVNVRLVE